MTHILITGISGTGKSTVGDILRQRGYDVIETDDPGWCVPEDGDATQPDHEWIWDEGRIIDLITSHTDQHLFVIGCRQNQGRFYDKLDHIVVLTAPLEVMLDRVDSRMSNPFGKDLDQRATIEATKSEVEPLLVRGATLVLDSSKSTPEQITDRLEGLLDL